MVGPHLQNGLNDYSDIAKSFASSSLMEKPRLLIIGASFGGLGTIHRLRENGGIDQFRITLVDSKDYFTIGGTWQFVWNDRITFDQIMWPLKDAEVLSGIEDLRLNTTVVSWDAALKTVTLNDGSLIQYDYVVLACGIVPDPRGVPGLENYVNICSLTHVPRQKEELRLLIEKARTERVTFVLGIGGYPFKCPLAPFEVTFLVDEALRKANVRQNVRIVITCPVEWPMPLKTRAPFYKTLQIRDIEFMPMQAIEKVNNGTIYFIYGRTLEATLLWSVYPIRSPDFVQQAIPTNSKGFVTVGNKATNEIPDIENGFAIGDCCCVRFMEKIAAITPRSFDRPALSKNGDFAWKMGASVADALINNYSEPLDRQGSCIAEIGFGKGIRVTPDFSEVCSDPDVVEATVVVENTEEAEKGKLAWVDGYLMKIFGGEARTLGL